jgi:hypothetical protein
MVHAERSALAYQHLIRTFIRLEQDQVGNADSRNGSPREEAVDLIRC